MGVRRRGTILRKSGGVVLAVAGAAMVIRVIPLYLWPLLLGAFLIWGGWQLYTYDCFY